MNNDQVAMQYDWNVQLSLTDIALVVMIFFSHVFVIAFKFIFIYSFYFNSILCILQ